MRAGLFISACEPGGSLDRDPGSGLQPPACRRLAAPPYFWPALLLAAMIFWASFFNLANYPELWWDEAIFSDTAANVVQHGRYAFTVESPNQLSDLDYRISAGPTVILPVALSYRLLGVGLVQGRLVAGLYLAFAFLALFLCSRLLFGTPAALLAVLLVLTGTDVVNCGRAVMGDVPALGLFLFATWLITRSLEEDSGAFLFLGGLFLGLAFDAKEFYGLAFLPPLAALAWQHWGEWRLLGKKGRPVYPGRLPPPACLSHLQGGGPGGCLARCAAFSQAKITPAPRVFHAAHRGPDIRRKLPLSPDPSPLSGWRGGLLLAVALRPPDPGADPVGRAISSSGAWSISPPSSGPGLPCPPCSWPRLLPPTCSAGSWPAARQNWPPGPGGGSPRGFWRDLFSGSCRSPV